MPAPPALEILWVTWTSTDLYPGLVIVAVNSVLRFIRSEHGELPLKPLLVFTPAPGGEVLISQLVWSERVTVAQPPRASARPATQNTNFIGFPPERRTPCATLRQLRAKMAALARRRR